MNRNPWDEPNVKAALSAGRHPNDIQLIRCQNCGSYGYYNEGRHFSCSADGCQWSVRGRRLDRLVCEGEVIALADYADWQTEEEQVL